MPRHVKLIEMMPKIEIIPAPGDTAVTIAELAKFITVDADEVCADHPAHNVAYDGLLQEYGTHEMVTGNNDFYDGFWMEFSDGSTIRYTL